MANRFRSDVTRVPPVRIGVAKGGLTTTIGWSEARASWSASGARSGQAGGLISAGDTRFGGPLPTDRYLIPGTRTEFGKGNVTEMTSVGLKSFKGLLLAASTRKHEIVADISKAKWQLGVACSLQVLGWATMACAITFVRQAANRAVARRRQEVATLRANLEATTITVDFDMDSAIGAPQRRMQEAFERILACQSRWAILYSQAINRVKARSTAGIVVGRRLVAMGRGADTLVATKDPPLAIEVQGGSATAYFYPGFVMIAQRGGGDFALVDLSDLDVKASATHFNETEEVPSDAQVVGASWAKANKDGSRDRRFAHNSQIPVARYGELQMSSPGGINESFMVSQVEPCQEFAAAVRDLKQILATTKQPAKLSARRPIKDGR